MEKSAHCCQIYLGSYSSAQALSEFFNTISLLWHFCLSSSMCKNQTSSNTVTYSFWYIYIIIGKGNTSLYYISVTKLNWVSANKYLEINNHKCRYKYLNKDSKWKTFCLFYLTSVAFKSCSGKRLDTTAATNNFDYLKVIYFKASPSFEGMCSQLL